jgi:hypothetical protein
MGAMPKTTGILSMGGYVALALHEIAAAPPAGGGAAALRGMAERPDRSANSWTGLPPRLSHRAEGTATPEDACACPRSQ